MRKIICVIIMIGIVTIGYAEGKLNATELVNLKCGYEAPNPNNSGIYVVTFIATFEKDGKFADIKLSDCKNCNYQSYSAIPIAWSPDYIKLDFKQEIDGGIAIRPITINRASLSFTMDMVTRYRSGRSYDVGSFNGMCIIEKLDESKKAF